MWPMPFDLCGPSLCTLPLVCVARDSGSPAHVGLVLGWRYLRPPPLITYSRSTLPNHHHVNTNPGSFPFNYPSPLSLRAAKVVKATAAVTNNSSSPVKELRDLSAMDAFRSRSISVSEHAVRRLGKILWGTEKKRKKKKSPPTLPQCFVARSMGWLMGCHVGPLGGFQGVGDACWREIGVSSELLSYTRCSFCLELFLHVVFAEAADSRFNSICLHLQFCVFLAWIVCYVWSVCERLMVTWIACLSNWKGTSFWGFVGFNHCAALVAGFSFFRSPKMFVWLWNCGVLSKTTVTLFDHVKSLYNLIIALTFVTQRISSEKIVVENIKTLDCSNIQTLCIWAFMPDDTYSEQLFFFFFHLSVYACFADGCVIKCCKWQTWLNSVLTTPPARQVAVKTLYQGNSALTANRGADLQFWLKIVLFR